MAKIFISYKRNVIPDTPVATAVFESLRHDHDVFMDTTIQIGEKWAERIQNAIKESDYLIIFLSENSVHSEMVIAEIETAYHTSKANGKPEVLPVRLAYTEPLAYPISVYLNPLQWALWDKDSDTLRLIAELQRAVSGGILPSKTTNAKATTPASDEIPTAFANILPRDLISPEGTMPHQSPFYIERETDREAMDALCEMNGVTITIKGPRQMGKSSLLNRLITDGCNRDMKTAFIDFQMIEKNAIENADIFYRQFCSLLSWEFEVEDRTEEFWKNPLGQVQKTTNYVTKYLLKELPDTQLLLAMDEVERMFTSPFRSDFFSMLRSWHNNRARGGDWTRFNLALVTSTEPYQLIADLNQSPFNVGAVVELKDFTPAQVCDLNQRHGNPLSAGQAAKISELLGGHPYLTRKALYLVASNRMAFDDIIKNACEDNGPFGDHLRNHLFRMSDYQELKLGLTQVIKYHHCTDEHIFFRLRGAGLVRRVGNDVLPRNQLYAEYFEKRLNDSSYIRDPESPHDSSYTQNPESPHDSTHLLTGKQLGPYHVTALLGEGGMAIVYKAYQPAMEREVALKVLSRRFASDLEFVRRFKQEAKVVAKLQHPHILPVFDFGEVDGYNYLVMPIIQGGTLADLMSGSPLPLSQIRTYIIQIGDALEYAHSHGLVHRDVKPTNVLMDESGNCLLSDFGLVKIVEGSENLTASGLIMGTPAYMSPEQCTGNKLDRRSDIYSLGIILYEMATGQFPYKAETPMAVLIKKIRDPLPFPRSINPELTDTLERVILKAMAKEMQDRYQSAGEMTQAIRTAIPEPT